MPPKLLFFLGTFAVGLGLDQGTKLWILKAFHYAERRVVIPGFFDLTYVRNPGGAFSLWADGPEVMRLPFFVGATLIAVILLLAFYRRLEPRARLAALALGAILGGAVGNLIDRAVYGEVIDFLEFHLWGGYTWPTFNVADAFIVVGVAVLLVEIFTGADERERAPGETEVDSASAGSG
jgi:signal peptidase II